MRHGATDALVAVEFTSGLDDRRYCVTRRLHRTRAHGTGALSPNVQLESSVLDVEQGRVFEQRAADVKAFLAQHLGVAGFSGPAEVFDRVVGVPQGRLTADFLDVPSLRRERFDPILRVDEFKRAFDGLVTLINHFKGQHIAHASKADELERQLGHRPAAEAALAEAERDAAEIARDRTAAQAGLDQAQAAAQRHDLLAETAQSAAAAAKLADSQLLVLQGAARDAEDQLAQAQRAAEVVEETRADHEAFAVGQQELERLGDIRGQRESLLEDLASLKVEEQRAIDAREQARQLLEEARSVSKRLAELASAATAEAEAAVTIQALNGRLAVARAAAERAGRAAADAAAARRELAEGLEGATSEVEAAAAQVQRLSAERDQASALQSLVDQLDTRRANLEELRAQRASVAAVMTADGEAAALLDSAQTCPFFDSECRNLVDVPDVALVFEQRASGHQRRLEQLETGEAAMQAALREAEDASHRVGDRQARRDALESAQRDYAAAQVVLEAIHPCRWRPRVTMSRRSKQPSMRHWPSCRPRRARTTLSAPRGGW